MNDTTPLLQMRGICKQYPGIQALTDAALEVRAGEVHALLGENGAGKSTLMKILSGAVRRDAGEVLLNGSPADLGDPNRRAKARHQHDLSGAQSRSTPHRGGEHLPGQGPDQVARRARLAADAA